MIEETLQVCYNIDYYMLYVTNRDFIWASLQHLASIMYVLYIYIETHIYYTEHLTNQSMHWLQYWKKNNKNGKLSN